jgi:hypothetical protein
MEEPMFRFERTGMVKHAADMPAALQNAAEITSYVNKRYALNSKFGVELYGKGTIHFYFDTESLDKPEHLNSQLMKDREYVELLNKASSLWVEGSLTDSVVRLLA